MRLRCCAACREYESDCSSSGGAAVLGPAVADWRELPFAAMEIEARIDGSPPLQVYTGAWRRHPLDIAAETFSDLRARGVVLEPGTCLLTGSLTLPTPIRAGQTVVARFGDLPAISLALEP